MTIDSASSMENEVKHYHILGIGFHWFLDGIHLSLGPKVSICL